MAGLQWLDGYAGQSLEELLALDGKCRVDSLIVAMEQALEQKSAREGDDSLSYEEAIVLAVEALEREVNNGGYSQFFVNTSRVYTPIVVGALRRVNCPVTAVITETAMKAAGFHGLGPEALSEALDTYQEEYIRRNRHRIVGGNADIGVAEREGLAPGSEQASSPESDTREKELDACDRLFYGSGENIAGQLFQFVRANQNAIRL
jgi:hypothetical protein